MCRRVRCSTCGKATWAGCGQHVDQVLRDVPTSERCSCTANERAVDGGGFLARLFRR